MDFKQSWENDKLLSQVTFLSNDWDCGWGYKSGALVLAYQILLMIPYLVLLANLEIGLWLVLGDGVDTGLQMNCLWCASCRQ